MDTLTTIVVILAFFTLLAVLAVVAKELVDIRGESLEKFPERPKAPIKEEVSLSTAIKNLRHLGIQEGILLGNTKGRCLTAEDRKNLQKAAGKSEDAFKDILARL